MSSENPLPLPLTQVTEGPLTSSRSPRVLASSLQDAESSHVLGSSGPRRFLRHPVFDDPLASGRVGQLSATMSLSWDLAVAFLAMMLG